MGESRAICLFLIVIASPLAVVLTWLILPGFLAVFFAPPLEYLYLPLLLPQGTGLQIAGLALIFLSLLLRAWTRQALRELYTGHVQIQAEHRLMGLIWLPWQIFRMF